MSLGNGVMPLPKLFFSTLSLNNIMCYLCLALIDILPPIPILQVVINLNLHAKMLCPSL